jgi:hypothetical protein
VGPNLGSLNPMACRQCQEDRELRRSHVLPEFLYTALYDDKHQFVTVPLTDKERERSTKRAFASGFFVPNAKKRSEKESDTRASCYSIKRGFVRSNAAAPCMCPAWTT